MKKPSNLNLKAALPWIIVALVLTALWGLFSSSALPVPTRLPYSELLAKAKAGAVATLTVQGDVATATLKDNSLVQALVSPKEAALIPQAVQAGATVDFKEPPQPSGFTVFLTSWGPTLLLLAVMVFMMRGSKDAGAKGSSGMFSLGKSKAKLLKEGEITVVFADVAGCDEAKQEVSELVEFLREPKKFEKLGGRIPRGVLLEGPPGTGKTLLARAIAGEAKVPFYSLSGSDFVEMLVGVGASRVRDLFKQAKQNAPCIIFIDELDAIGRQRGSGGMNSNSEQEQTLNQMLVEMDGFEAGAGVIVIAATNRADILDIALTRPGRFDRQVNVGLPDVKGREQILAVHMRKVPAGLDVDVPTLAKGSPGFSGAELANLVNEAALIAARDNKPQVSMAHFEKAKDKLLMGAERHSMHMSETEKSVTAYHEAGHTLIAKVLDHTDPLHKVSIIPRGRALGVTVQLPTADRYSMGKLRILDTIAMLFGGRVAEELFTPDVTTGASNDYERATKLARSMVMVWGMGDAVGPMVVPDRGVSPETARMVDKEVQDILEGQYVRVQSLLKKHAAAMQGLHAALMKHETLDATQVEAIMAENRIV